MQWIRWFGLDTVLSVVAVQLFLQQLIGGIESITWLALPWQPRYFIWSTGGWMAAWLWKCHRFGTWCINAIRSGCWCPALFWVACVYIIGCNFHCLLRFVGWLGRVVAVRTSLFLRVRWYGWLKPVAVAAIFSWVMVAGLPTISVAILGVIFGFTLLNLWVHACIETTVPWLPWACLVCWVMSMGLAMMVLPYWWLMIIFGLSSVLYVPLVIYSTRLVYWYELGELIYALPFLVACGLMF